MRKLELLNSDITLYIEELTDTRLFDNEIQIFNDEHDTVANWWLETLEIDANRLGITLEQEYEKCIIKPLLEAKDLDEVLYNLAFDYYVASKDKKIIVDWITNSDAYSSDEAEMVGRTAYKELQEYCQTIGYSLVKIGKYYVLGGF